MRPFDATDVLSVGIATQLGNYFLYQEPVPSGMDTNVGSTDKLVRIAVGAVAGIVSLAGLAQVMELQGIVSLALGIVAILMLGTAFTSRCAVYSLLGVSTR